MNGKTRHTRQWWLAAVLAALLTACADTAHDEPQPDWGGDVTTAWGDSLYASFRIVNTGVVTRADEDATNAENQIYDGIMAIFVGDNEAAAQLKAACVVDQLIKAATNVSDNTSETTFIQRLPSELLNRSVYPYGTQKLYALLLLNTSHTGLKVKDGTLYHYETSLADKTVSDFQTLELTSIGSLSPSTATGDDGTAPSFHTGLFMSNAPQSATQVLTEVTSLYDTWDKAGAGTQTVVKVERAAAKVKVKMPSPVTADFMLNGGSTKPVVHRMTWAPDNMATSYYAVRNTDGWPWGDFTDGNWAKSVNYDGGEELTSLNGKDFTAYQQQARKDGEVAYVMENTTEAAKMEGKNLTRVIVEVQLKDGSVLLGDCFAFENSLYTSEANLVEGFKTWWDANKGSLDSKYDHIKAKAATDVFKVVKLSIKEDFSVSVTLDNTAFNTNERDELQTLASVLSDKVLGFHDGKMYYSAKIRHTGDTPGALGYYGVVRSNYYMLTLEKLAAIGSPTPVMPEVVPAALKIYVTDWSDGGAFPLAPK